MYLRTIEIYCFVDDLLKANRHAEDPRRKFSDAELLTTAFVAVLFYAGNFERARLFLKESGLMPQMLSRSRFSRRLHKAQDLLEQVFEQFADGQKRQNWQQTYLLDSFPVAVCDNIRINRCRLASGESWRGFSVAHRRYFYGVRVSVLTDADGTPVEICILPGNAQDLHGLAELPLALEPGARIVADAAYTYFEWEDHLRQSADIRLLVQRKRNSRRADAPATADYKKMMRRRVETAFSQITGLFARKIHTTTFSGFVLKIALFVTAFAISKAIFDN